VSHGITKFGQKSGRFGRKKKRHLNISNSVQFKG